jgi:DNA polymerase
MGSDWAASALKWWQDAGVDTVIGEEPRNWLAPPQKPAAAASAPERAAAQPPQTLDAFQDWLRESPDLPFASPTAPRVGPSGDPASGLIVFVDMPSAEDAAAGRLLSGPAGALFDRMLTAMQRSRETIYLAPLSPVRSPSGAIDARSATTLAELARRHVALVRPKAVLLFGDACSKALIGPAVAGARGRWHDLETPVGPVKTLVTIRPEKLLQQPALKSLAWADLQMLMEGCKE